MAINENDRTLKGILSLSPAERREHYTAHGIEKVIIDGNEFTDYGAFSFLWEKTYVKSPVRSGSGVIGNLDSYATFVTPHLKIDFSMMSIDSYRTMMNLIYNKNEFLVTCYDVVNDALTTNRMYFSTEEMPKLWTIGQMLNGESWTELLGVQDYTVEMIGTNVRVDLVKVQYYDWYLNTTPIYEEDGVPLQILKVGNGVDLSALQRTGFYFKGAWSLQPNGSGVLFAQNSYIVVGGWMVDDATKTIKFYAAWSQNTTEYPLDPNLELGV